MKKLTLATVFCLILLFGFGNSLAKKAQAPSIPPTVVETSIVKFTNRQQQVSATGTLNAIPGIVVKPEISGRITKLYFKSGDTVTVDAPLIEIYPDILKAQLAQNQAQLQLAKVDFQRASQLIKTHDISESDFDKKQADYKAAQAQVNQTTAQLNQTTIRAPFVGRLGLSQVNLGDYVSAGADIVNLQSMDPIYVDFSIPELYLSKVAVGQTVSIHNAAYPNTTFAGKVEALESAINQANRTLMLRASIPNKDGKLIPGAFVEVSVLVNTAQQVIEIPQTAIVFSPEGDFLYKVENGKAVRTMVTLGDRDADAVVIKNGLKPDDVVVISGQLKIQDGSPVITPAALAAMQQQKPNNKK